MTTIAAVHTPGKGVTFGSDTQVTGGNRRHQLRSPSGKWIVSEDGNWAVGYCGTVRTANIIERESEALFMKLEDAFDFSQRLQAILKDYNFSLRPSNEEDDHSRHPTFDCALLLVSGHGIWQIGFDFAIVQLDAAATGSGGDYAAGALEALEKKRPAERVSLAIQAAAKLDPFTGGHIVIGEIKA